MKLSKKTLFILKIIGQITLVLGSAFVCGKIIHKATNDMYWLIFNYILHVSVLICFLLLQAYNYLYFVSGFIVTSLVLAAALIYKMNTYRPFKSEFFGENISSINMFFWFLFLASILTILLYILNIVFKSILKNKIEPRDGAKGDIGAIGVKGNAYELDINKESEYVHEALIDHADKEFRLWKIRKFRKFQKENPEEDIPGSYIFDVNEKQLVNINFKDHLGRICRSRDFNEKLSELTNSIINNVGPLITFDTNNTLTMIQLEEAISSNQHRANNITYLRNVLNNNFTINPGYKMELNLVYGNEKRKIILDPGKYIYNDYNCLTTTTTNSLEVFINIYDLIKNLFDEDLDVCNNVIVNISVFRDMKNFDIIRNKALCKITEYLKAHVGNWVKIICNDRNGEYYFSHIVAQENKISDSLDIIKNESAYLMIIGINSDNNEEHILITNTNTSLQSNNLKQKRFMILRDIDFSMTVDSDENNYKFIDTDNFCNDTSSQTSSILLGDGYYTIDENYPITNINISHINSKNIWNWGKKCEIEENSCLDQN